MIEPLMTADEPVRLADLRSLGILDTPPEERFDRITRLAQKIFDVPIALISLVDSHRQWFKSCQGLAVTETPRGISFCAHAILQNEVFVIEDALLDGRFEDNPLVTGGPRIRFYAGAPLRLSGGQAAGSLCVISPKPRAFGERDRALLTELANLVVAELEDVHTAAREAELREFVETAGALIQSFDQEGRLSMVNRAWTAALGYSAAEAASKSIFDLVASADHERFRGALSELSAGKPSVMVEASFAAKDGRRVRLYGSLSVVRRPDGTTATRAIFQDVTAQRELERVRSEVAHHVGHELKTPLAVTTLALDMLSESIAKIGPERKLLSTAQRGADQLLRMVEDLLEASRADSGKLRVAPSPGNLNAALDEIVSALAPLAAKSGLALEFSPSQEKIPAVFDQVRLRQILGNLIGNAMKFTPKNGRITVGARIESKEFVEIEVRDTGVGMKKEDLDRIFDRLYQTSNKALHGEVGLGLGLHICRELVAAQGGRIRVESELGKGTTFYFTLLRPPL